MKREFHYRWEWEFRSSPEVLWPLVADTNRFNRDTGLPNVQTELTPKTSTGVPHRRIRFVHLGIPIEFEEEPFEWVRPHRFSVRRRYSKGPVREMRVRVELNPGHDGGTRMTYEVWAHPANLLGAVAIPFQIGWMSARQFASVFRRYDNSRAENIEALDFPIDVRLAPGGKERLEHLKEVLIREGAPPDPIGRLCDLISTADDLSLARIRPYTLADRWDAPRSSMLDLCLMAVRAGLLDFRWDLLCPLCRGAKASPDSLSEIQPEVHCGDCNIDFTVNFDRYVELTFRPNPAVREIGVKEYCVGGPQVTPHIVAQQKLTPGEERTVRAALETGRYRLRTLETPGGQPLLVEEGGQPEILLSAASEGWRPEEIHLGVQSQLRLRNETAAEQLFILERMAWTDDAATAADVIVRQTFRDLFSHEALRPREQISVGSLCVLFTDLRGSTRLYREIGDAPAFGHVMDHFDLLKEAIAAEDGSLVKSIGDAVMAVFRRPVSALRAILKAQAMLASPPEGTPPLTLKAGMHYGPAIAVTLNERMDYFGSTVNFASRLESLSSGGDVVISSTVRSDPEVEALFREGNSELHAESFEATLQGFDDERFSLWRVSLNAFTGGASVSDLGGSASPLE